MDEQDRRVFWLNGLAGTGSQRSPRHSPRCVRGREAWRKLFLLARLRGQEQPSHNLPDPRLPARLPLPEFSK
jgi:hypothetical protein